MDVRPPQRWSDEGRFASTRWTTIRACAGGDAVQAARETLCRDYWYPVYVYIKRLGRQDFDAEDLTQEFFVHILGRSWFERADPARGRFRSFLLASLNHFLRDVFAGQQASKRGGGYQHVPLDLGSAESRYVLSMADRISPTEAYEVEWAANLVDAAWRRLEAEHIAAGKEDQFRALKVFLTVTGSQAGYEAAAEELGGTIESVKVGVHRLRKRYGIVLREEVARTVGTPEDVPVEMRHVRDALAQRVTVAA